jgi:preprotein translocase subunit SecG
MKKITLIMIFVFWFVIGIVYVSISSSEEKVTDPDFNEFQIEEDTVLDLNDSISIRQVRQMDSLHAAGKL